MPWLFKRRRIEPVAAAVPASATGGRAEIAAMRETLTQLSTDMILLRRYFEMWGTFNFPPDEQLEDVHARLDAGLGEITAQLTRLRTLLVEHERTSVTPSDLETAIYTSLLRVYDMVRDKGEFHAMPPRESFFSGSASDGLPLDPVYQYQLLFAHPLQPELAATLMVIPTAYAEHHVLAATASGVRRVAFNIHADRSPPGLIDALVLLQSQLWPVMWLVIRKRRDDGTITSRYWRCLPTRHMKDLPKFPDYLCLYFESQPKSQPIPTDPL